MNILINGVDGFSGGHMRAHLAAVRPGDRIIGTTISEAYSEDEDVHYCPFDGSPVAKEVLQNTRPGIIYHMVGSFTNRYEIDHRNNVAATKHLLDAAAEAAPDARILLIGSAAEYGDVPADRNPISEEQPLWPTSIYGKTKAEQTDLALHYCRDSDLNIMIARTFNLAGEGISENLFPGRVARLIQDYRAGTIDRIRVGGLDAVRDYVDIDIACEYYRVIAEHGEPCEVYNVGSGQPVSMRELLHGMVDAAGISRDAIDEAGDSPSNSAETSIAVADISRLEQLMQLHAGQ